MQPWERQRIKENQESFNDFLSEARECAGKEDYVLLVSGEEVFVVRNALLIVLLRAGVDVIRVLQGCAG